MENTRDHNPRFLLKALPQHETLHSTPEDWAFEPGLLYFNGFQALMSESGWIAYGE